MRIAYAILRYGIHGCARALGLRDSGLKVLVLELEGNVNWNRAVENGFTPALAAEVAKAADLVQVLTEDHM